jgi:hypothetical protein
MYCCRFTICILQFLLSYHVLLQVHKLAEMCPLGDPIQLQGRSWDPFSDPPRCPVVLNLFPVIIQFYDVLFVIENIYTALGVGVCDYRHLCQLSDDRQ